MNIAVTRQRAEKGERNEQFNLGVMYLNGHESIKQSEDLAFYWFSRSAEQRLPQALYNLGLIYHGKGEVEECIDCYKGAADQGHAGAQAQLGDFHYKGMGRIKIDYEKAFKWSTLAAKNGNRIALLNLGQMYQHGQGTEINFKQARKCFQRNAAESNDPESQFFLGILLCWGKGGPLDETTGRYWLTQAELQGHIGASNWLESS